MDQWLSPFFKPYREYWVTVYDVYQKAARDTTQSRPKVDTTEWSHRVHQVCDVDNANRFLRAVDYGLQQACTLGTPSSFFLPPVTESKTWDITTLDHQWQMYLGWLKTLSVVFLRPMIFVEKKRWIRQRGCQWMEKRLIQPNRQALLVWIRDQLVAKAQVTALRLLFDLGHEMDDPQWQTPWQHWEANRPSQTMSALTNLIHHIKSETEEAIPVCALAASPSDSRCPSWDCPRCTFHNVSHSNECDMCHMARPLSSSVSPSSAYSPLYHSVSPSSAYSPPYHSVSPSSAYSPPYHSVSPSSAYSPPYHSVSPSSAYSPPYHSSYSSCTPSSNTSYTPSSNTSYTPSSASAPPYSASSNVGMSSNPPTIRQTPTVIVPPLILVKPDHAYMRAGPRTHSSVSPMPAIVSNASVVANSSPPVISTVPPSLPPTDHPSSTAPSFISDTNDSSPPVPSSFIKSPSSPIMNDRPWTCHVCRYYNCLEIAQWQLNRCHLCDTPRTQ